MQTIFPCPAAPEPAELQLHDVAADLADEIGAASRYALATLRDLPPATGATAVIVADLQATLRRAADLAAMLAALEPTA
jgi:hypothetical protein